MKNTYLTSHFPLFSILLFSFSFSLYMKRQITEWLTEIGLYEGMLEFFSETGIQLTLLFFLLLFFFMVFSALKLIADTTIELSLLFFSKDIEGIELQKIRRGTWIYLIASLVSLLFVMMPQVIAACFIGASVIYFVYFVYKVTDSMTVPAMFGMIFFHISFWCVLAAAVAYAGLRLYNSLIKSLPL